MYDENNGFMSGYCVGRDANNGGNGGDMFGGNNAWGWIWIILIFAIFAGGFGGFGGWGGGFAGGMGGGQGAAANYVLTSDFSQLSRQMSDGFNSQERKLDSITNGLCDGFYTTAQLANGIQMQAANNTAALQSTLTQGFAGLNTGMIQQGYETRLGINGVGQQLAQCCCDLRSDIAGINYNNAMNAANVQRQISDCCCDVERQMERGFCDSGYRDATNTTTIVQSAHNDTDRILARLDRMESDRQAERIAQLTADNNALKFQISQEGQSRWLYEQLGPKCPQAAYVVQPPQQVTFPTNCCGGVNYAVANGGCGCGYNG